MNISSIARIDFYVSVVDNFGDMGFAINFALSLHAICPKLQIRFFSDDLTLFQKFFPGNTPDWIEYLELDILMDDNPPPPEKLICNFFDYKFPRSYLAKFPSEKTIVSFSYFLLHEGLESLHGTEYMLESGYDRVIHYVPSLLSDGGGIIMNPTIEEKKNELLKDGLEKGRQRFLRDILSMDDTDIEKKTWISIFTYRESLGPILENIRHAQEDTVFFIFGNNLGLLGRRENIIWMPFLPLEDYGVLQSLCDANVVRGENSLCQGLIAGKPVLWDIYKENNGAQNEKIEDYLIFLKKQFPKGDWEEYGSIMRGFNDLEAQDLRFSSFLDFLFWQEQYQEVFGKVSEYIKSECDLVRKFEKILEAK